MGDNLRRLTVRAEARAEIEEKKSVFIGTVAPVSTEEEAREFIDRIKKEHYDARHNVFAYVLDSGNISRFTDDGEPKGSAGIPVLNVLKMSGVDGVCVVVTRYFGGILLGTGGLVRAYSAAAKAALDASGIVEMEIYEIYEVRCSYSDYQKISSKLSSVGAAEEKSEFGSDVKLSISCLPRDREGLRDLITQITSGSSVMELVASVERPKNI